MRKLASFRRTGPLLREVWTLPNVLLVAVEPFIAISEDSEIATDTLAIANEEMGEWAIG